MLHNITYRDGHIKVENRIRTSTFINESHDAQHFDLNNISTTVHLSATNTGAHQRLQLIAYSRKSIPRPSIEHFLAVRWRTRIFDQHFTDKCLYQVQGTFIPYKMEKTMLAGWVSWGGSSLGANAQNLLSINMPPSNRQHTRIIAFTDDAIICQ